ncbi:MAG: hypothetical protein ACJ0A9_03245 [Dehalococcoidia bacterium]
MKNKDLFNNISFWTLILSIPVTYFGVISTESQLITVIGLIIASISILFSSISS